MPMGECDRVRNYISAYIEKTLDPTTSHKIENHLTSCPDCIGIVKKISTMQNALLNLNKYHCSENFSLNLRDQINTAPKPNLFNGNIKKYSYAFSFVLLAFIMVVSLNSLFNQSETQVNEPIVNEFQMAEPKPSQPPMNIPNNTFVDEDVDIQTRDGRKDSTDFVKPKNPIDPKKGFKYVDQPK
jgi:hypothetical protein